MTATRAATLFLFILVVTVAEPPHIAAFDVAAGQSQPPADPVVAVADAQAPAGPPSVTAALSQPPPVPLGPPAEPGRARQYTGHPVSLDFQQADLRAVLRVFSEISGLNIVIDPAVQGTVDVALRDVPWDQALDIILRANKLDWVLDGSIVRIAPRSVFVEEEVDRRRIADERQKAADMQSLAGELKVIAKVLSYAKAEDMKVLLTRTALSPKGRIEVDLRTNTVIITDLQERLNQAADLIATLDRAQPQVEIEARILQTNKDYARALGVQWGLSGRVDPALGNTTNLAFPNNGSVTGRTGVTQGPAATPTGVNLPATGATSAIGLALGSLNGAFNLDVALTALERSGNGKLLSTPRVTTQNNVEAEVKQGVQIPVQTAAAIGVPSTVTFKDAALTLKVTPQITAAGTVIMKIEVVNATPDYSKLLNGNVPINTQGAITTVLVSDGQTTMIGGIYTSAEATANDRTPGLTRVPFLKWLFRRDSFTDTSSELLIFITPRIIGG